MSDCCSIHTNSWTRVDLNGQSILHEVNSLRGFERSQAGVQCTLAVGYGVLNILHVHTEILLDC